MKNHSEIIDLKHLGRRLGDLSGARFCWNTPENSQYIVHYVPSTENDLPLFLTFAKQK
jgi:hypothetical protein